MARPLRIQFPGAVYHVTCRGNDRNEIFQDDADRLRFLEILEQSVATYGIGLHSFVLMPNHFHLLVETPRGNLGEFMRHFNVTYTSYFNRTHGRTGHLYQGRYKSLLVAKDTYLSRVSRYIHLNPARTTGVLKKTVRERLSYLRHYEWSSLPGFLNVKERLPFVSYGYILEEFGGDTPAGRRAYGLQLAKELEHGLSIEDDIVGQTILGDDTFVNWVKEHHLEGRADRERPAIGRIQSYIAKDAILRLACEHLEITTDEATQIKGWPRYILMDLLYRYGGLKNREIGDLFGIDYSTVSVGRKRLRELVKSDRDIHRLLRRMEKDLSRIKI